MECQPPSKILQLKCSMYHATFCIKHQTNGPPEEFLGTSLFYLCMPGIIPMVTPLHSFSSSGIGFD